MVLNVHRNHKTCETFNRIYIYTARSANWKSIADSQAAIPAHGDLQITAKTKCPAEQEETSAHGNQLMHHWYDACVINHTRAAADVIPVRCSMILRHRYTRESSNGPSSVASLSCWLFPSSILKWRDPGYEEDDCQMPTQHTSNILWILLYNCLAVGNGCSVALVL